MNKNKAFTGCFRQSFEYNVVARENKTRNKNSQKENKRKNKIM